MLYKKFSIHMPVRLVEQIIDNTPVRFFITEEKGLPKHTITAYKYQ